jgi:hypothetical protein
LRELAVACLTRSSTHSTSWATRLRPRPAALPLLLLVVPPPLLLVLLMVPPPLLILLVPLLL